MEDCEPSARVGRPAPPPPRELSKFRRLRESSLDGLMCEVGMAQPICPGIGPPLKVLGRGKAPGVGG
jgi:hypothetical protein